ncbi:phage antirepressor KilAC domain-containing protein [Novosphingobium capsulatum]|uniref:phage antirepressor KilAC domain-containing protein n=1 Tax=Novosphingobium capsulatum TaxID=13688 RepID=UPI00142F3684|nr:phage regulatory protein/antirepressor Ant [Novosphingobium capsulatum]WQD92770.1 phage regulatory protein/antirepressor Ant [Novosphingobium capsulatum]
MSSREIADLCEARHNQVVETIGRLFEKGVLRESRKTTRPYAPNGGGRPTQVYDLTKRDTLVVASGYNDELRARIIDRWQELEAQVARPDPVAALSDPAALRHLLLGYSERVIALEHRVEADAPKVAALDRLEASEGSVNVRIAAKMLNVPERKFTKWLQAHGWAFRQNGVGTLQAYHAKREAGYLEHRPHTYHDQQRDEDRTVPQMMVTPKGLAKLASLFGKAQGELL